MRNCKSQNKIYQNSDKPPKKESNQKQLKQKKPLANRKNSPEEKTMFASLSHKGKKRLSQNSAEKIRQQSPPSIKKLCSMDNSPMAKFSTIQLIRKTKKKKSKTLTKNASSKQNTRMNKRLSDFHIPKNPSKKSLPKKASFQQARRSLNNPEEVDDIRNQLKLLQCDIHRTKMLVNPGNSEDSDNYSPTEWEYNKTIKSDLVEQFKNKLKQEKVKKPSARREILIPRLSLNYVKTEIKEEFYTNHASEHGSNYESESELESESDSISSHNELSVESFKNTLSANFNRNLPSSFNHSPETEPVQMNYYEFLFSDKSFDLEVNTLIKKEIKNYLSLVSFKSNNFYKESIDSFMNKLYLILQAEESEILDVINTPAFTDPMDKLAELRNKKPGDDTKGIELENILSHQHKRNIQTKMKSKSVNLLFACANQALNFIRPYGIDGLPYPWSSKSIKIIGENAIETVIQKIYQILINWANVRLGSDYKKHHKLDTIEKMNGSELDLMICEDVIVQDHYWNDYEDEEFQVVLDIDNEVFDHLLFEILCII